MRLPSPPAHYHCVRYFLLLLTAACLFAAGKSDSAIETDMRARLSRSKLAPDGIQVHVHGGVATLTGRTGVVQHKGTATRMAKSAGATSVVNKIEVSEAARQEAAERLASGRNVARSERRTERAVSSERTATTSSGSAATKASDPPARSDTPAAPPVRRAQIKH